MERSSSSSNGAELKTLTETEQTQSSLFVCLAAALIRCLWLLLHVLLLFFFFLLARFLVSHLIEEGTELLTERIIYIICASH